MMTKKKHTMENPVNIEESDGENMERKGKEEK